MHYLCVRTVWGVCVGEGVCLRNCSLPMLLLLLTRRPPDRYTRVKRITRGSRYSPQIAVHFPLSPVSPPSRRLGKLGISLLHTTEAHKSIYTCTRHPQYCPRHNVASYSQAFPYSIPTNDNAISTFGLFVRFSPSSLVFLSISFQVTIGQSSIRVALKLCYNSIPRIIKSSCQVLSRLYVSCSAVWLLGNIQSISVKFARVEKIPMDGLIRHSRRVRVLQAFSYAALLPLSFLVHASIPLWTRSDSTVFYSLLLFLFPAVVIRVLYFPLAGDHVSHSH